MKRAGVSHRIITYAGTMLMCFIAVVSFSFHSAEAESWSPESTLQAYLENNYPWQKIEISNVSVTGDLSGASPDQITVEKGPVGKGVFSFTLDDSQKVIVKANVRALDTVVKSIRPLKKGYVLQDSDVYLSEMDIKRMPRSAVKEPDTVIGKPLKRSILADMVIVEDMVEKNEILKKGSRVVLLYSTPGFTVTASGEIKEKGQVGSQVRAVNLSSRKEVRGVLIDENTVRVEL